MTAVVAVFLCSVLNAISPTMGTNSTVVLTVIKIGALVFVAVLGAIVLVRDGPGEGLMPGGLFNGTLADAGNYAIAIYSGLWAFDGWDACCVRLTDVSYPEIVAYSTFSMWQAKCETPTEICLVLCTLQWLSYWSSSLEPTSLTLLSSAHLSWLLQIPLHWTLEKLL